MSRVWLLIPVVAAALLGGCAKGDAPTAEDDAFQKQLAAAAAKNQGKEVSRPKGFKVPDRAMAKRETKSEGKSETPTGN